LIVHEGLHSALTRLARDGLALLLVAGLLLACEMRDERRPAPRNLVVISVDTLRADHLGVYGYGRDTSPRIDALASDGTVFEQAMSTAPWTLPSHVSMLTGLYPSQHRVHDDGGRLAPEVPTLAARFADAGFHTFAVVSHIYVASPFGLDRGFAVFDDSLLEGGAINPRGDAVVDRFVQLLDAHLGGSVETSAPAAGGPEAARAALPFFAFVHFFDPHWDYGAPPPFARRFVPGGYEGRIDGSYESMVPFLRTNAVMSEEDREALVGFYDGEIAYVDAQVGGLLDALDARGLRGSTTIVLTADHGEEFKEHKRLGHGRTLFDEQLHVPLIVAGHPRLDRGRRSGLVSLVDLTPTLLDLFGLAPIETATGRSLARPQKPEPRFVFAESIRFGIDVRAVRSPHHKLIDVRSNDRKLFYDLAADPGEQRPRRTGTERNRLEVALDAYLAASDEGWWLQLIGRTPPLRLRARARVVGGRILDPRHYFSGLLEGREARFERFELSDGGRSLEIDVEVERHMGSIRFETEPPDAAIEFEIDELRGGELRVAGRVVDPADPRVFARDDEDVLQPMPRLADREAGVYLGASPTGAAARAAPLSRAARARLEALGYADDEE
jgi:arylsulfatase A-like enzyme